MMLTNRGIIVVSKPLLEDGRMIAGIVMRAIGEFDKTVFRKVVAKGAKEDAHMESVPNDPMTMLGYRYEMFERMTHATMIIQTASVLSLLSKDFIPNEFEIPIRFLVHSHSGVFFVG